MASGFRRFFSELRRRGVLKAGGIYLAGAWVLVQVVDVTSGPVGMPAWVLPLTVWLVIIGFPLTLAITWRYDITLDGIRLTRPIEDATPEQLRVRKRDLAALAVIALVTGMLAVYLAGKLRLQQAEIAAAWQPAAPVAAENSIAVLPFDNLGGDEENYLGQGLAEDILHRLASMPGMAVASRTASFELDRSNLDMAEIGRRLGVLKVLEGSVRREGDQVRIVAQLIDAKTGYHLWSSRYDRNIEDLFRIYDEISTALATELQLTMAPETRLVQVPPTANMEAYDYFLQARSILQRASRAENAANAQRLFAFAVDSDPQFAEAWAGQCRALLEWHVFEPSPQRIEAAESSCRRALEIDPDLADSHAALGDLYRVIGAHEAAISQYRDAFRTEPALAAAWRGIGLSLAALGREQEAMAALDKSLELDPDDLLALYAAGEFMSDRGRFKKALGYFERMAAHPRADASAFNALGFGRSMLGDFQGAAEAFRQVISMDPTGVAYSNVGVMYYFAGNYDAAVVMLREAVSLVPDDPVNWSNLGDALRETSEGKSDALEAYENGVRLAEGLLAINASDVESLTTLAHCQSRLGNDAMAMVSIQRVLELAPDDPYAHYYRSLIHLEAGREREALGSIRNALELNYPVTQLRNDPQFHSLRNSPEFTALLAVEPGS